MENLREEQANVKKSKGISNLHIETYIIIDHHLIHIVLMKVSSYCS